MIAGWQEGVMVSVAEKCGPFRFGALGNLLNSDAELHKARTDYSAMRPKA